MIPTTTSPKNSHEGPRCAFRICHEAFAMKSSKIKSTRSRANEKAARQLGDLFFKGE